jgi:hypothetical protein
MIHLTLPRLAEVKLRASDKTVNSHAVTLLNLLKLSPRPQYLNKLRTHNDIRFEVKKVEKTSDKTFLLIQVNLLLFTV